MFFWNSLAFLWSNGCWKFDLWGSETPQETEPDLPVSVQESLMEMWVDRGLPWGQSTDYSSPGRLSVLA